MNNLTALTSDASITSLEISELVGSRHDDVKRSINRLIHQRVIAQPPMADVQISNDQERHRSDARTQ